MPEKIQVIQGRLGWEAGDVTEENPESLKPHPRNIEIYGEPELDQPFLESVREKGVLEPLVITKDKKIISGHRRWTAAKKCDIDTVPVRIAEFDNEWQEREALIEFNRQREKTFKQKMREAQEIEKIEQKRAEKRQEEAGRTHGESLRRNFDEGGRTDEKVAEEVGIGSKDTYRKAKEVWDKAEEEGDEKAKELVEKIDRGETSIHAASQELKRQEEKEKRKQDLEEKPDVDNLFCGDALEEVERLDDDSVDVLLTDPPYGIDYSSNRSKAKSLNKELERDDDGIFPLLHDLLHKLQDKMKDDGHLYIFGTWKTLPHLRAVIEEYAEIKNVLIWEKNNHGMGDLHGNYAEKYEIIVFASMGGRRTLNYDNRPTNVFKARRVVGNDQHHPTQKPVELLEELIRYSTYEGETVFDPFAGAGSTLVAAEKLDRNWYGAEIDEEYCEAARQRILEVRGDE